MAPAEPSRAIPLEAAGAFPATVAAPSGARSAPLDEKWVWLEQIFTRPGRVERVRADSRCGSRVKIAVTARVCYAYQRQRLGAGAAFSCGVFRTAGAAEAGGGRPATVVAAGGGGLWRR